MIQNENFWNQELESPLMRRNRNYLTPENRNEVLERANAWRDIVRNKVQEPPMQRHEELDKAEFARIVRLDAERTFATEEFRTIMENTLAELLPHIGDYHQGLAFIVAFLLLQLSPEDVIEICKSLNDAYLLGYFRAASVAYFRDAKVFGKILHRAVPSLRKKIEDIPPETFCSKWFIGLYIHVLPFDVLADFFDLFFLKGHPFLYQFGIAFIRKMEPMILTAANIGEVLQILRLDERMFPEVEKRDQKRDQDFLSGIFDHVNDIEKELEHFNIQTLTQEVEVVMAKEEELRKQRDAELSSEEEIVFSDEEQSRITC